MSTNKEDGAFGGFEQAFDFIASPVGQEKSEESGFEVDESYAHEVDPEELEKQIEDEKKSKSAKKSKEEEPEEIDENDEDGEIEDENEVDEDLEDAEITEPSEEDEDEEIDEGDEDLDEKDIVDPFFDLFSEELGWEVDEEEKPKSIKELLGLMSSIIEENSAPNYASEDIKKLDDFVKNGGDIKEYFDTVFPKDLDLNSVDLSNGDIQKAVVKEHLKTLNYSDSKIERRLERYEEAGTLEEEAEEAVELLKEYNKSKEEKLLKETEKRNKARIEEQQRFISNVEETINSLDSIQGIPLSKKDKKELYDYLFKVNSDGKTAYQKDYSKDVKSIITSAFFLKNGEKALNKVKSKADSDATLKLKNRLKNKRKPKQQRSYQSEGAKFQDALSSISKVLAKN